MHRSQPPASTAEVVSAPTEPSADFARGEVATLWRAAPRPYPMHLPPRPRAPWWPPRARRPWLPGIGRFALALLTLPLSAATFNRTLDLAPTALRPTPVPDMLFGANVGYWSVVNSPELAAAAQEAGLTALRYHPGTYSNPHAVDGAINQWDFTAVDDFGAARLGDFGRFLIASGTIGQININYGGGSIEQAAALVAYLRVPIDAPAELLNRSLGSAVLEPSIISPPSFTRTRDWRTVGFWANLRASAPLPEDDGFNKLRLSHPAPFPIKYFETGNEADYKFVPCLRYRLPGENSITKLATGFGGRRADAHTYANFYAAAKTLMQEIDPTIQVGASAGYFEQAYDDTDSPAVPFLFPGGTGTTRAWTPVMLTRLRELGVTPDFIVAHRYTQQTDFAWNNNYLLRGALLAYLAPGQGALPPIQVTELNWKEDEQTPFTTTIGNGVNLARSFADALQHDVHNLSWFTFTSGSANHKPNFTVNTTNGWRRYHNWGIIADDPTTAQNPTPDSLAWPGMFAGVRFPTFHAFALLKQFARPGDHVYQASALSPENTNADNVTVFAARRANGDLSLLILNRQNTVHTLNLTLTGTDLSTLSTSASGLRYGRTQDEEQRLKAIATPPVLTNNTRESFSVNRSGNVLTYTVPRISVSTLTLAYIPPPPAISSALTTSATLGVPFSYTITASNGPTSFSASGLPAGLTLNPTSGLISGTPTAIGVSTVTLGATNVTGTGNATLTLTVNTQAPAISSPATATGNQSAAFLYPITASNSPTSFTATGLPAGLSLDPITGLISGTPTTQGNFSVLLEATNVHGTGALTLVLSVAPPSEVIYADTLASNTYFWGLADWANASGSLNFAAGYLSYDSALSPYVSTYGPSGIFPWDNGYTPLPSFAPLFAPGATVRMSFEARATSPNGVNGLKVEAATSYNPNHFYTTTSPPLTDQWQTFTLTSLALEGIPDPTNITGLAFTTNGPNLGTINIRNFRLEALAPVGAVPVVSSATSAAVILDGAFSYTITASNSPTSFSASGLPAGLSLDGSTGIISGTPSAAGVSAITLMATNAAGTGHAPLTLTVTPLAPVISSALAVSTPRNEAFSYTITASHGPISFTATGLPAGLSFDPATGVISGTPGAHGESVITLGATNPGGTGEATLTLAITLSAIEQWRFDYFGTPDPTGAAAPEADDDGDGLSNLLEYALGSDPTDPASSPAPVPGLTPSLPPSLSLTFLRARADVTYEVLATSDLATPAAWELIATNPGEVSATVPVTVIDPEPVSTNPRRFLRLRITAP